MIQEGKSYSSRKISFKRNLKRQYPHKSSNRILQLSTIINTRLEPNLLQELQKRIYLEPEHFDKKLIFFKQPFRQESGS